jgi:hypothetical protein
LKKYFPENKALFEFEQAIATKTILVTGINKSFFPQHKRDSIALAIIDVAHFAFKWLTTTGHFFSSCWHIINLFCAGF